jgi:GMP synthase-like glutamine amidotransferase
VHAEGGPKEVNVRIEKETNCRALILQNASGEGPGILGDILDRKGWDRHTIRLYGGEEIPSDWENYHIIIVMGGPMNVYEEDAHPFLVSETRIIREGLEKGFPVLGFCLGAQLMAKASGAKVYKGQKKEIGWYPVRLSEEGMGDPLLKSFPDKFTVFQWHGDTFHLPQEAICLVGSDDYSNQAMRIGTMGYGFQFHFEITKEMIAEWLESGREEIKEMGNANLSHQILRDTDRFLSGAHALAEYFFIPYLTNS